MQTRTYQIAGALLPVLAYGDESGITDEEVKAIDEFIRRESGEYKCFAVEADDDDATGVDHCEILGMYADTRTTRITFFN